MSPASLGALVDDLFAVREQLRMLNKQAELLEAQRDDLKRRLIETMRAAGTDIARSEHATATLTSTDYANVVDWDAYLAWERKTNRPYMRERRISQGAFREYLEASRGHKPPPGIEIFIKDDISLRTR